MLKVFFTFDTEIWCDGWDDIDAKFPRAYKQYVYGTTKHGDFAMPHILKILNDHGLAGVFFVEPLFAARFGLDPLRELVGLTQDAGQEVQLHLHTEWVDVARQPLLPDVTEKFACCGIYRGPIRQPCCAPASTCCAKRAPGP